MLQAALVGVCVFASPALRLLPSAVLWGYFAFMAVEALEGSQLWQRTLLLATDPGHRRRMLQGEHPAYIETVPFHVIACFTLLQLVYLGGVFGLTWAGIAGVLFPVPILALIPLRQYVLPRLFDASHLRDLDAAEYEEAAPVGSEQAAADEAAAQGLAPPPDRDSEVLGADEEAAERHVDEGVLLGWRAAQVRHRMSHEEVLQRITGDARRASLDPHGGPRHRGSAGAPPPLDRACSAEEGRAGPPGRGGHAE